MPSSVGEGRRGGISVQNESIFEWTGSANMIKYDQVLNDLVWSSRPELIVQLFLTAREMAGCMQFVNALGVAEKLGGATFTIRRESVNIG